MKVIAYIKTETEVIPIYDEVIAKVVTDIAKRSEVGIKKYCTTLHENSTDDFYKHAYEELLDFANYATKIIFNDVK